MDATSPDVDQRPSGVTLKFHFPYRPSNLLCSALIFWTVLCIISEAILPLLDIIFTITIYGPTIYLAAKCIRQKSRGTYGPTDSDETGAAILAGLWILIIPTHVYIKSIEPKYSEIFLIPLLPGSQAIFIVLYIILHYTLEKRARRFSDLAIVPSEEEVPPPSVDAESQPLLGSDSQFGIYRPSRVLLVVSMLFAVGSWATETLCLTWGSQHRNFGIVLGLLLIWLYVPLIRLQLYSLKRASQRCAPTLVDEGGIGNYSMDLAAFFVGMKPLIVLYSVASTQCRASMYTPGFIQVCLVVYIAVRYAWSFSKAIPRYAQLNRQEENAVDAVQAPVTEPVQVHDTTPASSSAHSTAT